jgi:tRNA/tmRNA/rRNA uracil-C5-methylase (TrmA/RlmC/RlmD family)
MMTCPHRPPCPGCPRFGEPGIAPAASARLDALAAAHGLPPVPVVEGPAQGFRHRARLAIRHLEGAPFVGLFEQGTHRLVQVPHCIVHHPLINEVAGVVRAALVDASVSGFDEARHIGCARYLQVVVERASQSAQVVLVANDDNPAPLAKAVALIHERLGERLHSLWFNANTGRSNVILGRDFQRQLGPESVVERFGGAGIHYPPGAFGQASLGVAELMIGRLRELVPPGARVVEYHAGVGAIGLSLLDRVGSLWLNERGEQSLHGLALGLAALEPADRARIAVVPGAAAVASGQAPEAEVVIVDPPRKGLEPALLAHLAAAPPPLLLYISCDPDSLLRDTAQLCAGGALRLAGLSAWNLMPYTGHVETLAVFERA